MLSPFRLWLSATSLVCFALSLQAADPMDWIHWRGPHQNGVSDEVGLIDRFDPKGGPDSNVIWKSEEAAGISTPIVKGNRLFTIVREARGTPKEAEKVICLDTTTGQKLWENVYNVFLSDVPAERVGWSHVAGDHDSNRIYALGACCLLQCIDGETGKTLWSHSLSEEFGMLSTYGGRTNTPVVFEDLVVISGVTTGWDTTARPAHRFLAFDKLQGSLRWIASTQPLPEDTTYSTPVFTVINGQQVMIAGSGDGYLYGFQPRTGKILWKEALSRRGVNTSVAFDESGAVYATHGEENPNGTLMGAVVRIDAAAASIDSASAERWRTEELIVGKSSPLLIGNRLYVVEDSSRLQVLDTESGEIIGRAMKLGTSMRGSLVYADGKIYACTGSGYFHILRPSEEGVESIFKVRLPSGTEVGGSPIVSHGRIYLPTTEGLYCLGSADVEPKLVAQDHNQPQERAVADDQQVAQLQVVPAEAIVSAGDDLQLQVVAYNALGQRLDNLPSDLSVEVSAGGQVDNDRIFHAAEDGQHKGVTVIAHSGTVQGESRLRTTPSLPWRFDFSDGNVPVTWIGARYRHEARKVDGEPMIVKISTIPKGTRSQTWMGKTDYSNYTITADVKAEAGTAKLPDIGVIAQRYTFDLMGESQQLQIRTWPAQLRMAKSVPFVWQADTWYTLKFRASSEGSVATLQAKIWKRGEAEPDQWTLSASDESPNIVGSPGLYGNATNAEIMIDNVTVTMNE